jgi:predicted DNA-binding protein with PD1-like motif
MATVVEKDVWEQDATSPVDYHYVEGQRGREFILRLTTGADVWLAIQKFAQDKNIRFAKIHSVFMGGLKPARFLVWAPDTRNPNNWHNESEATVQNLSMVLAMGGVVHPRFKNGVEEPFPAIHFVIGGAWDVPTTGGHMLEGSIVRGVVEVFFTEILGIDVLYPHGVMPDPHANEFPENWYKEVK